MYKLPLQAPNYCTCASLLLVVLPIPHSQQHYSISKVYCCCDDDPEYLWGTRDVYLINVALFEIVVIGLDG